MPGSRRGGSGGGNKCDGFISPIIALGSEEYPAKPCGAYRNNQMGVFEALWQPYCKNCGMQ